MIYCSQYTPIKEREANDWRKREEASTTLERQREEREEDLPLHNKEIWNSGFENFGF
jgi:hypothetical protein